MESYTENIEYYNNYHQKSKFKAFVFHTILKKS